MPFRYIVFFFVLFFVLVQQPDCAAQATAIPKGIDRKIQRDAARLALRSLVQDQDYSKLSVMVPTAKYSELYGVLSKLYLGSATARSLEKCGIHTFPDPSIDHLIVILDKKAPWAQLVKDGASKTGNSQFNSLVDKYGLTVEKSVQWDNARDAIVLRSKDPLNMAALAGVFQKIENVSEVQLGIPSTLGNDLQAKRVSGAWEVTYLLRFGAYISGNGKEHRWVFRLSDNGTVHFIGESGDPLPDWMDCLTPPDGK